VNPRLIGGLLALVASVAACTSSATAPEDRAASDPIGPVALVDVAREVGLDFRQSAFRWEVAADPAASMGTGLCWIDYDDDGWMDLFVVNSYAQREATRWQGQGGLPRSALFHNVQGRFEDASVGSGADLALQGQGCVAADLDLDGRTDLYVTSASGASLLWNEGDGSFTEGAGPAGVEAFGWHTGAAVGDVNGDGWPDLFVAGYVDLNNRIPEATLGFPNTYAGVRDLLYLSDGPGDDGRVTFSEVGREAGLEVVDFEYGLGASFSDFDLDGDLDLYVANDTNPNRLYDNVPWPGGAQADPAGLGFRFEELAGRAGVADPNAGMGVAEGDFDGDGRPDLFVSNARGQHHAVFRSRLSDLVDPAFVDAQEGFAAPLDSSTGWGVTWADLDLDSDLDVVLVNGYVPVRNPEEDAQPVEAFENLTAQGPVGRFTDMGDELGLDEVGSLLARGSAAADFDNDGDLDIAVNTVGGSLVLLESVGGAGHWLEVDLGGPRPGALVEVVLPDGRVLVREAHTGSSYLSSEDPRCHFGLGDAGRVEQLTVTWPGGEETVLTDVAADQLVALEPPG
jgi:hypothetical protein